MDYSVTKLDGKTLYLLCSDTPHCAKRIQNTLTFRLRIHHSIPSYRKAAVRKIRQFKWNVCSQQNVFTKVKIDSEAATKLSFWLALLLAKQEKPLINSDLMKLCFDFTS